ISLLGETSDYWKFSSCGEVIGLVRQPGQQFINVEIYNTKDGSSAGPGAQIATPVHLLQLQTTSASHVATNTVAGTTPDYTLGPNTPACPVSVAAHSPVNILLTDELGRRTGFDSGTGAVVGEIPGGSYSGVGTEPESIIVPFAPGTYVIEATGLASLTTPEPYRLTIATADEADLTDQHDISGIVSSGAKQQFIFTIDDRLQ